VAERLLLVRSAATAATRRAAFAADEPLDAAGERAAAGLTPALGRVEVALTGPALRARQTAKAAGLDARAEPGLEALRAGSWSGLDLAEVGAREPLALRAWLEDPDARPPGGESRTELSARVARFLEHARELPGGVVAVTHASVVRAAVVLALGAPPQAFWHVDVAPASVTELRPRAAGWLLARCNWVGS
jgi:broad specificity phosphatase PhoE